MHAPSATVDAEFRPDDHGTPRAIAHSERRVEDARSEARPSEHGGPGTIGIAKPLEPSAQPQPARRTTPLIPDTVGLPSPHLRVAIHAAAASTAPEAPEPPRGAQWSASAESVPRLQRSHPNPSRTSDQWALKNGCGGLKIRSRRSPRRPRTTPARLAALAVPPPPCWIVAC